MLCGPGDKKSEMPQNTKQGRFSFEELPRGLTVWPGSAGG